MSPGINFFLIIYNINSMAGKIDFYESKMYSLSKLIFPRTVNFIYIVFEVTPGHKSVMRVDK